MNESFLGQIDVELKKSVSRLKESAFFKKLTAGQDVRALYVAYLREAFHFVRLTSSFTPLAARRMDLSLIKVRKWILEHSSEELGHELMAQNDLAMMGFSKEATLASEPNAGTMAWVSFFHYHVAIEHPFAAFGVLYFLEGMAAELAPVAVKHVIAALGENEKRAVTFFREHGVLDVDHVGEQRELLAKYCTDAASQAAVLRTIGRAGYVMRLFLDTLVEQAVEPAPENV